MDLTLDQINKAISQYGYISNISHQYDKNEIVYGLGAYSYEVPRSHSSTVEMKFSSYERLNAFLNLIARQHQEEILRASSPTLQKAWEEYQILLKLS